MYTIPRANEGEEQGPISSAAGGCTVKRAAAFRPHRGLPEVFFLLFWGALLVCGFFVFR